MYIKILICGRLHLIHKVNIIICFASGFCDKTRTCARLPRRSSCKYNNYNDNYYYYYFLRNFFPFHLFRFLLLCIWKQKESLMYKTMRRKAVILMKIT